MHSKGYAMSDRLKYYLYRLVEGECLTAEESAEVFGCIMQEEVSDAQIAALLTALRVRGETVDEIMGAAMAMRTRALPFSAPGGAIDMCGTGGDALASLNISTAVAFIVAACGVPVAKHGNRSVSSLSGSADVLEHLGVNIFAETSVMERAIRETHMCFIMGPKFHPAMQHVATVRKALGIRTMFNILGPLSNPATISYQLLGVYALSLLEPMAYVLKALGIQRAWVVHGSDGMDELTITGVSYVAEVLNGSIGRFELNPRDYGFPLYPPEAIKGGDSLHNAEMLKNLLQAHESAPPAYKDIILLNAGACLMIAGVEKDLHAGIAKARRILESGKAYHCLEQLIHYTNV